MKNISPQAGCDGQSGGCFLFVEEVAASWQMCDGRGEGGEEQAVVA